MATYLTPVNVEVMQSWKY